LCGLEQYNGDGNEDVKRKRTTKNGLTVLKQDWWNWKYVEILRRHRPPWSRARAVVFTKDHERDRGMESIALAEPESDQRDKALAEKRRTRAGRLEQHWMEKRMTRSSPFLFVLGSICKDFSSEKKPIVAIVRQSLATIAINVHVPLVFSVLPDAACKFVVRESCPHGTTIV